MNINIEKDKYIILELIPSHSLSEKGDIVQLSALKIEKLQLLERFDYRLDPKLIENKDLKEMISYDKKSFKYTKNKKKILEKFKEFSEELPLLIIDNYYTRDYLKTLDNKKESVFSYLNLNITEDVFDKLIKKYNLEESNHLVDLLYEGLIYESNNK